MDDLELVCLLRHVTRRDPPCRPSLHRPGADTGDTTTMVETVIAAAEQVEAVLPTEPGMAEVVADKGYPTATRRWWTWPRWVSAVISRSRTGAAGAGRARPKLGMRCMRTAVGYGAIGGGSYCGVVASCWSVRSRIYMTRGGMRRVHLRGHSNILKRVLVHAAGGNLGLLLRHLLPGALARAADAASLRQGPRILSLTGSNCSTNSDARWRVRRGTPRRIGRCGPLDRG